MLTAGFYSIAPVTSQAVSSVYFSFFCLLASSVSNFHPDTMGQWRSLFKACSVVLWGRRDTANKSHWRVWGALTVSPLHWVCPCSRCGYFPSLHCSGSRLLCRELSEAGPGLHALPRSKPLRFRFSGPAQRRRLGWACVLCPSQVRAAEVTRCLASAVAPCWGLRLIVSPSLLLGFLVYNWHAFSGVWCVSSGELISGCNPPSGCQPFRIPRSLG